MKKMINPDQAKFDLVTELTDNMTELGKVDSREADQKTDYPVEQEKTVIIRTRQRRRPEASDSTPNDSSELTQQSEGTPIPEAFQQSAEMAETPRFEAEPTRFPFPIVIEAEAIDPTDRSHAVSSRGPQDGNGQRSETIFSPLSSPSVAMPDIYGRPEPRNDQDNGKPRLSINELTRLNTKDLRELANFYGISHEDMVTLKKQEIIFSILKAHTERGGIIYAYGSLEILPDGYGFLRSPQNSYLPGPDDIYISPSQIRLFALKTGDTVYGQIRSPKEGERFFAMLRVETVNYDDPSVAQSRIPFDNLTPL